jgi:Na+-transporting NADH:ubiquinone oxidoreductase subunit A
MALFKVKKGLDIPITGDPEQIIKESINPASVAILGDDYVGMRPTMEVGIGDRVKLGQLLFTDKKNPKVCYTSPGAGKVVEINRGAKRHFLSLVIELDGEEEVTFKSFSQSKLGTLERNQIVSLLGESGLWTSIRVRPFCKVATPDTTPHSIFITAIDTNPLAPSIEKIVSGNKQNFLDGLQILSKLTDGKLFLCKSSDSEIPTTRIKSLSIEEFFGPHPAGNSGTHIHFLDPVSHKKFVWYVNAQDVIQIGSLFTTGRLNMERIISLAGPAVIQPRLIKTRIGAAIGDITKGQLKQGENRTVSGSILSGHHAIGPKAYLGRFHQQISVLPEGRKREFFGWVKPGLNLYSVKKILLSSLIPNKKFDFTTSLNGGPRAIVPIGNYEKLMPLDIIPTYLLRALAADDIEEAESLGCLELDEEDLALCTFACPSKIDHGANLRRMLTLIEKEG